MVRVAQQFVQAGDLLQAINHLVQNSMAEKKTKAKSPSRGLGALVSKITRRKPAAPKRAAKSKRQAAPAPKAATASPARNKSQAKTKGKGAPPPAPDKVKRKPTSITITRPEATRPPLVELPPRKLEAPIGAPSILLPKGGQAVSPNPILRWMYVGGATRYEV